MRKKLFLTFGFIGAIIISIIVVSLLINPSEKSFTLDVSFNKLEYTNNDKVEISAVLKNNSIGIYNAKFSSDFIIISVYEFGEEEPVYQMLSKEKMIYPFSTLKKSADFTLDLEKDYHVKVFSQMTIKNQSILLVEEFTIENGVVIEK